MSLAAPQPRDLFQCERCGAGVARWQVEKVVGHSRGGDGGSTVLIEASPVCQHEDGSRWAMRLIPVEERRPG